MACDKGFTLDIEPGTGNWLKGISLALGETMDDMATITIRSCDADIEHHWTPSTWEFHGSKAHIKKKRSEIECRLLSVAYTLDEMCTRFFQRIRRKRR